MTFTAWELGTHEPCDRWYPELIVYLGCEPWAKPEVLGDILKAERRRRGIGPKEAARLIGISEGMLRRCEVHDPGIPARVLTQVNEFVRSG
jgi:hypothetical protein